VSHRVYALTMTILYLTMAPLALLVRWLRPSRTGWLPPGGDD
jgi:hypothetical protein